MLKFIKKMSIILLYCLTGLIASILLYFLGVLILSHIAVNKQFKQETSQNGIEIFLLTNGVHTDVVMPIRNSYKDWSLSINAENTIAKDSTAKNIAFGWGDKGFYLYTPEWSDLKFSTAFNAMFFMGTTAMHVTFYQNLHPGQYCKKIRIHPNEYKKLVQFVENSFQKDKNGKFMVIGRHSYGKNDCFYEANGTYNLFYTCNTWTNNALKTSGLKSCYWTPFQNGVMGIYE
jgi:uncharacterized protein (TIGR02117 family)